VIVVDSSVLVKYFSREPGWKQAEQLLKEGAVTVELALKELANALWKKVLRGEMDLQVAETILRDLARGDVVKLLDQTQLLPDALRIAAAKRITVYDALFIAAAKKMGLPLATADKLQAEVSREAGIEAVKA
jgi:predicted nucleic acid-binding protein